MDEARNGETRLQKKLVLNQSTKVEPKFLLLVRPTHLAALPLLSRDASVLSGLRREDDDEKSDRTENERLTKINPSE